MREWLEGVSRIIYSNDYPGCELRFILKLMFFFTMNVTSIFNNIQDPNSFLFNITRLIIPTLLVLLTYLYIHANKEAWTFKFKKNKDKYENLNKFFTDFISHHSILKVTFEDVDEKGVVKDSGKILDCIQKFTVFESRFITFLKDYDLYISKRDETIFLELKCLMELEFLLLSSGMIGITVSKEEHVEHIKKLKDLYGQKIFDKLIRRIDSKHLAEIVSKSMRLYNEFKEENDKKYRKLLRFSIFFR